MKKWIEKSKKLAFKSILFKLFEVEYQSPSSGIKGHFDVIETSDWANIVPITKDGNAILVKQFRYGSNDLSLEFPAGVIEVGEDPLEAIKRELLEETGGTGKVVSVGSCRPNPAFMRNHCFHFAATDVVISGDQDLDHFEELEIVVVPENQIDGMIERGEINHSLSIVAWHLYKQSIR